MRHFRLDHGIILRKLVVPFNLHGRQAVPCHAVKEDRFLDGRHQAMADTSQHGVIRPNGEIVFAALLQAPGIVVQEFLGVDRVDV